MKDIEKKLPFMEISELKSWNKFHFWFIFEAKPHLMNNGSEIKISCKIKLTQWLTISMTLHVEQVDCDGLGGLIAVQHQSTQFNPFSSTWWVTHSSLINHRYCWVLSSFPSLFICTIRNQNLTWLAVYQNSFPVNFQMNFKVSAIETCSSSIPPHCTEGDKRENWGRVA